MFLSQVSAITFITICFGGDLVVGIKEYEPLRCNTDAPIDINSDECLLSAVPFSSLHDPKDKSSSVTIPCGKCVVMDDYANGFTLHVPEIHVLGRLHFPSSSNVVIRTTAVFVQGTWSMEIPEQGKKVKLVLYGDEDKFLCPHDLCRTEPNDENKIKLGKKPFAVVGGKLDIRAVDEDCPSWTKLKNVIPEDNAVVLDAAFVRCLRPGDDLLVTSDTSSVNDASTFTVGFMNDDETVVLNEPLPQRVLPSEAGPGEPTYASEVALLRRDVVFEAESDPDDELIGGHSIVFETPRVSQTIHGVRFDNFGQAGILGRYPIHFHISRFSPSSISKNVVVNSNQRCVFIHSTNNVTVHDNVAFETHGHCFATEMGDERFTVFSHNLGASTRLLSRTNGQSDSATGFHSHQAATFWFRSPKNTFVGNVAAGSESLGFWFEMANIADTPLEPEFFEGNVAHSNNIGLTTYRSGWFPTKTGILSNFATYKNQLGCKFHRTGNVKLTNALLADNVVGAKYGAGNAGLTIENSTVVGLSRDSQLRREIRCPYYWDSGLVVSINNFPKRQGVVLQDVLFDTFVCGRKTLKLYHEARNNGKTVNPLESTGVSIVNSDDSSRPTFLCDDALKDAFLEDFDGTWGPPEQSVPGFVVRNDDSITAFLPENACDVVPYDKDGCTAYCQNVCLRLVRFTPFVNFSRLILTDDNGTSQDYPKDGNQGVATVAVVLPQGQYRADFVDVDGNSMAVHNVLVETFRKPRCDNYVVSSDVTFVNTAPPSPSPSQNPTVSNPPTLSNYFLPMGTNLTCPNDNRRSFRVSASNLQDCYSRCDDEPTCHYFTFDEESKLCTGCDPTSLPLLQIGSSDTYKIASDRWLKPAGTNIKCPYNESRLFKTNVKSFRECYDDCYGRPGCEYFAHNKMSGDCLGCNSNALPLSPGKGFDAYEMVTLGQFPYDVSAFNHKCSRDDRVSSTTLKPTRKGCYNSCRRNNRCDSFAYGEGDRMRSSQKGLCLLCGRSTDALDKHLGFNTYVMKSQQRFEPASLISRMDFTIARLH